jgi:hypothetical protein
MLHITARASSGVRQPWSPVLGFLTRSCKCWPPANRSSGRPRARPRRHRSTTRRISPAMAASTRGPPNPGNAAAPASGWGDRSDRRAPRRPAPSRDLTWRVFC